MNEMLGDELHRQVVALSKKAEKFFDKERYSDAVAAYQEALGLLPDPKNRWEAATWLYASIGDALYQLEDFRGAREALLNALNCPDAIDNPFIQLRLGQSMYDLQDEEGATEYLLRAYMLDGKGIFKGESKKYLEFLRSRVTL